MNKFSLNLKSYSTRTRKNTLNQAVIYLIIFAVVYIRHFTEKIVIFPRIFQFLDLAILVGLIPVLIIWGLRDKKFRHGAIAGILFSYIASVLLSTLFNLKYTSLKLLIAFLFLQIGGILIFWFLLNAKLTKRQNLRICYVLFWTGIIQILVSLTQIPEALVGSPDFVAGTFGYNNSQMIFFLVTFSFSLFGLFLKNSKKWIFYSAMPFVLVIFLAASFRFVWFFFPFTVIILWSISRIQKKKLVNFILVGVFIAGLFSTIGIQYVRDSEIFSRLLRFDYNLTDLGKVRSYIYTFEMFADNPGKILFGMGPGTYGSRTYRTFGAGADYKGNPTAGLINVNYKSPFVDKYLEPAVADAPIKWGSTVDWGYSSYLSNLGETGLIGVFFFFLIYWKIINILYYIHSRAHSDIMIFTLSLTAIGAILFLAQMALNDDWFGVARVTVPTWIIIGLTFNLYKFYKADKKREMFSSSQSCLKKPILEK